MSFVFRIGSLFAIALHIYMHTPKVCQVIYSDRSMEISSLAIDDNALLLLSSD
ncbi:hypothetical protein [Nostoc sp.]|uniref:hypothetical protein n=1 Tax=Nostoc sp. TaxID=1180 RepID=UPI002FF7F9B8